MERHFVDAEVLRDLRDGDAVLTGPGHSHDVFAELLGVGSGHGAHPSRPPCGQARSDVTYPRGSPWRTGCVCRDCWVIPSSITRRCSRPSSTVSGPDSLSRDHWGLPLVQVAGGVFGPRRRVHNGLAFDGVIGPGESATVDERAATVR